MPRKPKRPCNYPGCPLLVEGGESYCPEHKGAIRRARGRSQPREIERMYGYRWRKYRKWFLGQQPLCQCDDCAKLPVPKVANVVDHIIPHRGDYALFWDETNHQAMNKRCHDRKTAAQDGGFGHARTDG